MPTVFFYPPTIRRKYKKVIHAPLHIQIVYIYVPKSNPFYLSGLAIVKITYYVLYLAVICCPIKQIYKSQKITIITTQTDKKEKRCLLGVRYDLYLMKLLPFIEINIVRHGRVT